MKTLNFFSKVHIIFLLWEGIGVLSLTHVNLCSLSVRLAYLLYILFVLGFIYLLMLTFDSFTLRRLFDFIFAHVWFNGVLRFPLKNLLCGKSFFFN